MANKECILKIKEIRDILINSGYNVFEIDEGNILVKTPKGGRLIARDRNITCNINKRATVCNGLCNVVACPNKGDNNCPLSGNYVNIGSNSGITPINTKALFRVRVNDIESGINVHAILLDGHTDLKVSYPLCETKLASKVVDLINFLAL